MLTELVHTVYQKLPTLSDARTLDQLAGLTGIGWTASMLGYLAAAVGVGNSVVSRLVADPVSLLYLGGVLLVATLGLDRLQNSLSTRETQPPQE